MKSVEHGVRCGSNTIDNLIHNDKSKPLIQTLRGIIGSNRECDGRIDAWCCGEERFK